VIQVRALFKSFGDRYALRGVDLEVADGECLALVGPNGAGKTTMLRILATLTQPSAGTIRFDGLDWAEDAIEIRRRVGFLSHLPLLYEDLSCEENLRFYGRMYDVANLEARIGELLDQVGLALYHRERVRTFSRGMKQRLSIARAFLHDPVLLLLDEPYTGLDQQASSMLDAVLQDVGVGTRTVILTTHDLERGLEVSDRAALLVRGEIVYQTGPHGTDKAVFRREYERLTA